jgi:predicted protein tyrosine phosphatase
MFISRAAAEDLAPNGGWALISVSAADEGPASLKPGWSPLLRLEFADADPGCGVGGIFDLAQAKQVVDFIEAAAAAGLNLLVHCYAGISRSAAIARFAGEHVGGQVYAGGQRMSPSYDLHNKHVYRLLMQEALRRRQGAELPEVLVPDSGTQARPMGFLW